MLWLCFAGFEHLYKEVYAKLNVVVIVFVGGVGCFVYVMLDVDDERRMLFVCYAVCVRDILGV